MSTPAPDTPPTPPATSQARRWAPPRKAWWLVAGAFAAGLLLFLALTAGRGDDAGFFRAGSSRPDARGEGFEPLPTPDAAAATGEPLPQGAPRGEDATSIAGTGENAGGAIEPPPANTALPPPVGAPPPAPATGPVDGDTAPRPLRQPQPDYPAQALRRGEQGIVLLQVQVDASGRPTRVDVAQSSRSRALDREAVRAVRGWTFSPAIRGGRPVPEQVRIPIEFKPG